MTDRMGHVAEADAARNLPKSLEPRSASGQLGTEVGRAVPDNEKAAASVDRNLTVGIRTI